MYLSPKKRLLRWQKKIGMSEVHPHKTGDGKTIWMPGKNMEEFQSWYKEHDGKDSAAGAIFIYEDPKTGELYHYARKGLYKKSGRTLLFVKKSRGEENE